MNLEQALKRKKLTVLGLNSGTSADGLDMAVTVADRSRGRTRYRILEGTEKKYSRAQRERILSAADRDVSPEEIILLDNWLGRLYGRAAARYLSKLAERGIRVDLIASHGQTIRHFPNQTNYGGQKLGGTLQLGSLDMIAAATDRVVVGDFRQADVALGGEGAPITTGAVARLLGGGPTSRLAVNIGGMSNYFYLPRNGSRRVVAAADCGPGNVLCDLLTQRLFARRYDRNGARAASGTVSRRLLTLLEREPFFASGAASTGREAFGEELAKRMLDFGSEFSLTSEDVICTAAELTAGAIARAVRQVARKDRGLKELYLTGGGRRNKFLVKRLRQRLPDFDIMHIDELGVDGDRLEAASYAVMGEACLRAESLETKAGRRRRPILGRIAQPPAERHGVR